MVETGHSDTHQPGGSLDDTQRLQAAVNESIDTRSPLGIVGGGSKAELGESMVPDNLVPLELASHRGVVMYEPTELVVRVRSGTTLEQLVEELDSAGQRLAFEPPLWPGATVGGVIACGLSGPARPFLGAARDYVLGVQLINGHGQILSFGGDVMKNVAGYDVSRLQVGAWGTLGVLLDVSMKVLPKPEHELTLCKEIGSAGEYAFAPDLRQPIPVSGAMQINNRVFMRLSGSESAVEAAAGKLGGEALAENEAALLWRSVNDHTHPFFAADGQAGETLWRLSVPAHTPPLPISGRQLQDWAGALRWLITTAPASEVFDTAAACGGHAMRYSGAREQGASAFQPIEGAMRRVQQRLRDSFDPLRLFNRGRFHPELDPPMIAEKDPAVAEGN